MKGVKAIHSGKPSRSSIFIWTFSWFFIFPGCANFQEKKESETIVSAVTLEVRESGPIRTDEPAHLTPQATPRNDQELTPSVDVALQVLIEFDKKSLSVANAPVAQLKNLMDSTLVELDALAIEENLIFSERILEDIRAAQQTSLMVAAAATESINKGLWIKWSEKLLLTHDALKHFFSEKTLNTFEKAIDSDNSVLANNLQLQLKEVIHRDHERRLIAMMRRHEPGSPIFNLILEVLAASGGPLARLQIYQRFISTPNLELANAMAKSGLPRISDLLGANANLSDGIPFVPETRPRTLEIPEWNVFRNFKNQWKELKEYFDDIRKIPYRYERSRTKWVEIHEQIDSLINMLSIDENQKNALKKEILQTFRSRSPQSELVYKRAGVEFREGDIVLLQTGSVGGLWETFTQSGSLLSHLLVVSFGDDGLPYGVEMNFGKLLIAPLDLHADRYTVVRPRNLTERDRAAINRSFSEMLKQDIEYDFRFDSNNLKSLYCSELAAAVYNKSKLNLKPTLFQSASGRAQELLGSAGVSESLFYAQGSYLASSDFEVIAQHINSDPRDFIRGQLVLEAFEKHIAESKSVKLYKHPEAHQIIGLSTLAQTVGADLRRALGPQKFLFTVMTLDKLLHSIEAEALGAQTQFAGPIASTSRIIDLKNAISESLSDAVPKHLSAVFPPHP